VVLCVEIENPADDLEHLWCVTGVGVEIGGKGGKATVEPACDPTAPAGGAAAMSPGPFPLILDPVEQYNLLYAVTIASGSDPLDGSGGAGSGVAADAQAQIVLRSLGAGEMQRPVAITVRAYPVVRSTAHARGSDGQEGEIRPTTEFSSRWNCTLDLTSYFAGSQPVGAAAGAGAGLRGSVILPGQAGGRKLLGGAGAGAVGSSSRPGSGLKHAQNQIAGDKRYSLASLLVGDKAQAQAPPRGVAQQQPQTQPLMPSQIVNHAPAPSVNSRDSRVFSGATQRAVSYTQRARLAETGRRACAAPGRIYCRGVCAEPE
jgi:hypothetical protein